MARCIVCGSSSCHEIVRTPELPVLTNRLADTAAEARAVPRAALDLVHCAECQHIFNADFDASLLDYAEGYENALHFSPHFRGYLDQLVDRLIDSYPLAGKRAVEIGCGDGFFLDVLRRRADMVCLGYDPSVPTVARSQEHTDAAIEILTETLAAGRCSPSAELVCARHVLEHVDDPVAFLKSALACLSGPEAAAYIEVPNGEHIIRGRRIWDVIYEHVSYFSARSLACAIASAGGAVLESGCAFDRQFLWVDAGLKPPHSNSRTDTLAEADIRGFAGSFSDMIGHWGARLDHLISAGRRIVMWGAGSKGISFLNLVGAGAPVPDYIVDLNSRKTGKFVAGGGQAVVPPEFLKQYRPDIVIIMNATYRAEIAAILDRLGLDCDIITV